MESALDANVPAEIQERLVKFGQEHVTAFWAELSAEQRSTLAAQIIDIDFELMTKLAAGDDKGQDWAALAARAESPPAIRLNGDANQYAPADAASAGEKAIRDGKFAVLLVAGGQGSRLGFPHPKGMYPVGPVSGRTLFQIHADRIAAMNANYGVSVPFFVMTSPATHQETVEYFEQQKNFGLSDVTVFCQGTMPAVDAATGKLMLSEKHRLFKSPNGHGGTLAALVDSGSLALLHERGIEQLFYFQVDNPLVDISDTKFLGYHILSGSEMTSQVVAKQDPLERVGNVVSIDGGLQIIEYSDLADEQAKRLNADGSLAIWAGSIAVHIFEVAFLERVKDSSDALPYHLANKAVPHIDAKGNKMEPTKPNAIKFEKFIFDLLPSAKNALVVEVAEAEAFAPLKNAAGAPKDTEATVQAAMVDQHRRWLAAAGANVADGVKVEINPRFAASPETLTAKLGDENEINEDRYFEPS